MDKKKQVLAFDFGASSGRAMLGIYDDGKITMQEVHRFSNDPVIVGDTMYWDTLRLFYEIKQGIIKAKKYGGFSSIGIDTWGVDFGLLDKDGKLLESQVHYRDMRTSGMLEESFKRISKDEFYKITGLQFMEINTAFQLLSLKRKRPQVLEQAQTMLMTPDLFNYFLTGVKCTEYSIASTSQLLNARKKEWSERVVESLEIPRKILTNIVPAGTIIGKLTTQICEELGVEPVDVVAVASHDTQSALVATPAKEKDFVFLSCGTWSLLGTELDEPIISANSEMFNITNEGGYGFKATFLKNIIGLWLVQESRRQWMREGFEYGFGELESMAKEAAPFLCFIDPDVPEFILPGNIPKRICKYCEETNQPKPQSVGEVVRCINESLAMKYRYSFEQIKECTKKEYKAIYMVGGGTKSKLLCQMTANACNVTVYAGPVEATVLGNIAVQLIAEGCIASIDDARRQIAKSEEISVFEPKDRMQWDAAYKKAVLYF